MGVEASAAQSLRELAEIEYCCDGHATGRLGGVLFSTTDVTPPMGVYDAADALSKRLLRDFPEGFCQLMIAKPGLPMPSAARRARIAESMRRFNGKIRAIAMVFPGGGLWSSSMRMVGNTMMMVIPSRFPRRMFGELAEAVDWLAESCPRQVGANRALLKQLGDWLQGCPRGCRCPRNAQGAGGPQTTP